MIAAEAVPQDRLPFPKAILFDWDNTLVNSWSVIHEALNQTFAEMGTPAWSLDETRARVRHSLRDSFPRLFGASWDEARQLYLRHFEAIHLDRLTAFPGAALLLDSVRELGLYAGVVSNKTGRLLRREVAALGWEQCFVRVIGAGDAAADKPDCAPVSLALEGSGVSPGEVWFVGDTDLDLICAQNAGCVPILMGSEAERRDCPVMPRMWFENCEAIRNRLLSSSHLQYISGVNKLDTASSP